MNNINNSNNENKYIEGIVYIDRQDTSNKDTCFLMRDVSGAPMYPLTRGTLIEIQDCTVPLWERTEEWISGVLEVDNGKFQLKGENKIIKIDSSIPIRVRIVKGI